MKNKIIFFLTLLIVFIVTIFIFFNFFWNWHNLPFNIRSLLDQSKKNYIKTILTPYKVISEQKKKLSVYEDIIGFYHLDNENLFKNAELNFKKSLKNIALEKQIKLDLKNNLSLIKYKLNGLYSGIYKPYPGSGYLDFFNDKLILLSSKGILAYQVKFKDEISFKQIKNNINEFIHSEQFNKNIWFSIKDLKVHNNKIFISFTEEIEKDCWNTSVLIGDMNYENINFHKLFSPDSCVHSKNNLDKEFNAHQSGGRIESLDDDYIALSIGEYRSRFLAQDLNSPNGKIIKINIQNGKYKIISIGHRNIQGLLYDKNNNFLLATEHGPKGGDEINLINLNKITVSNYGWPIASYGNHYIKKTTSNDSKYDKYPLLKSHKNNGFIEPLKYHDPSIGISEIIKIKNNFYAYSSLKAEKIYFFNLNDANELIYTYEIDINERIRDMIYKNNKIYLFLESSASIGIINLE